MYVGLLLVVPACQLDAHSFHVTVESHLHFLAHAQSANGAKAVQFSFLSHTGTGQSKEGQRKVKL